MNTIVYQFKELLAITKLFIEQEYGLPKKMEPPIAQKIIDSQQQKQVAKAQLSQDVRQTQETLKNVNNDLIEFDLPINEISLKKDQTTEQKKSLQAKESFIHLEPLAKPVEDSFSDIKKVMRGLFPSITLSEKTLDDTKAKSIKDKWKQVDVIESVIVIAYQESKQELDFLYSIVNALTIYGTRASLIFASKYEKKGWDSLLNNSQIKFIIAKEHFIYHSRLKQHYKESAKSGLFYLNEIPLFQLADLSVYFKEPNLKALLWKSLRARLKR